MSSKLAQRAQKLFIQYLRENNLKVTQERLALLDEIFATDEHLDADDLLARMKGKQRKVSRATVYRTLDALETGGHLVHCHLGHGPAVYHLPSEAAHIHVVCDECGAIASVSVASLGGWIETVRSATGFEVDPTHMGVTGRCAACAADTARAAHTAGRLRAADAADRRRAAGRGGPRRRSSRRRRATRRAAEGSATPR